jgi:hypothetical protein
MDEYLDRLNTTWERYGGKNTCSVVQIIDRVSGRRSGARIYPLGCKVREVVEDKGLFNEKKTKFDKKGRMKAKKVEQTSKHYVNMIRWPPELENKNIYEPEMEPEYFEAGYGHPNNPHRMKYDTGAEVSLTDWNGMRALVPRDRYRVLSYPNIDIEPAGVEGRNWEIESIEGVT